MKGINLRPPQSDRKSADAVAEGFEMNLAPVQAVLKI
jgi:hypothetical protein